MHLAGDLFCIMVLGFAERTDEIADGGCGLLGRRALDERDNSAANDCGVSEGGNGADVLGVGNAEAECDGEIRELLEAADELFGVGGKLGLRPGDADA